MDLKNRISNDLIINLEYNEIFVFGSNLLGIHGTGAAKKALEFGAVMGKGCGYYGRTYAIPTKITPYKSINTNEIKSYVDDFINFSLNNPELTFLVTAIGTQRAGHSIESMSILFKNARLIENIKLPKVFWDHLSV